MSAAHPDEQLEQLDATASRRSQVLLLVVAHANLEVAATLVVLEIKIVAVFRVLEQIGEILVARVLLVETGVNATDRLFDH